MYLANDPTCALKEGDWVFMPNIGEGRVQEVKYDFNDDGVRIICQLVIHMTSGQWMLFDLTRFALSYQPITFH